ncbi:hypothetical protein KP509_21G064100 [Ceratopteris richardii]|uniref:Uncharacterized protein n=1 Tax=Ceratopteris richardii TaxID=49495 RepID=A0A8T2SDK8_CERRI|nr:hypothetical protein KP509_21G064100 [Ceratopteris richardii]
MSELAQKSVYCRLSGRDMGVMEMTAYGDVHMNLGFVLYSNMYVMKPQINVVVQHVWSLSTA